MSYARVVQVIAAIVLFTFAAQAQTNPYRVAEGWPQLPAGIMWGGVISVDSDANGNIWVFHRSEPPILKFDPSGKLVASLGKNMFAQAHGMTLDRDGNVWVTDAQEGIRIGSAKDGKVTAMIPFAEPDPDKNNNAGIEGVTADANGNIYGAEVSTQTLKKYVKK